MIITDKNALNKWLDENYEFADGYVASFKQENSNVVALIGIYESGSFKAFETVSFKEYTIKITGITKCNYELTELKANRNHCIEGIWSLKSTFGLNFFDQYQIAFKKLEVSEPEYVKVLNIPHPDDHNFTATFRGKITDADLIQALKNEGIKLKFRVYGGDLKTVQYKSVSNFKGHFLQTDERADICSSGIFISNCIEELKKTTISFQLTDKELIKEWHSLKIAISKLNPLRVYSGNIHFTSNQWLEYAQFNKLPNGKT